MITLPSLHIEGLIFGAPFVELDGSTHITSSSGYSAKIDYSGKGWLSGKKNSVVATLYKTGNEKDVLYNATGQWNKEFEIYEGPAKKNSKSTLFESHNAETVPQTDLKLQPVEQQHPLESRRAWGPVAEAIQKGDMDTVSVEKGKIEHAQRALRTKEAADKATWERRYFTAVDKCSILEQLSAASGVPEDGDRDKTGGLWRFDAAKDKAVAGETVSADACASIKKECLGQ